MILRIMDLSGIYQKEIYNNVKLSSLLYAIFDKITIFEDADEILIDSDDQDMSRRLCCVSKEYPQYIFETTENSNIYQKIVYYHNGEQQDANFRYSYDKPKWIVSESKDIICLKESPNTESGYPKSLIGKCCCICKNLHYIRSHPWIDGKPVDHIYGYACIPNLLEYVECFAYEDYDHPLYIQISKQHGICELFDERKEISC